jgi:hypothetical protein
MKVKAQLGLIACMTKLADRQPVSPTSAALSSLLPFGAFIHGTVAGHSPWEGLREEVGNVVGSIPGNIAGGAIGAAVGGAHPKQFRPGCFGRAVSFIQSFVIVHDHLAGNANKLGLPHAACG